MKYKSERNIEQIQAKDGTWVFRVRFRHNPEIPSRRFSEKKYNSCQIAWMEAKKYRNQMLLGEAIAPNDKATVKEVFDGMQDMYCRSYETRRKEKSFLNHYISKFIDMDKPFKNITTDTIQRMINDMSYTCTRNTMSKVKTTLNKMYIYAIDKGICNKDLTRAVIIPKPKVSPKPKGVMTTDNNLLDVIDACKKHLQSAADKFNYPQFLLVGYYTGMRPSEIFALNKTDIDLVNKTISVSKSVSQDDIGMYYIGNTKTESSNRVIPINDELIPILKKSLKYKPKNALLFPNSKGGFYNSTSVSSILKRLCERRNLKFNMYQLRHTFIQNLIDNGIQLRTIMSLCGHADPSMVIKYSRSTETMDKIAINTLGIKK